MSASFMTHDPRDAQWPSAAIAAEDHSDSDVSDTSGLDRHAGRPKSPRSVVKLATQSTSDSVDALQAHQREIESAESFNDQQFALLRAQRHRKDERLRQRRDVEDRKINALKEARKRHDDRVSARRAREDESFNRAWKELDEEDFITRNRMKRLKRGQPVDEPFDGARHYSVPPSASPASQSLPSAKRHQAAPPDATYTGRHQHPIPVNGAPNTGTPSHAPPSHPSYQFYQPGPPSFSVPYHHGYNYAGPAPPPITVPSSATPAPAHPSQLATGTSGGRGGQPSHGFSPPTVAGKNPPTSNAASQANHPPNSGSPRIDAPRPVPKEYNTRPPDVKGPLPPAGFASVNGPPAGGFASINSRSSGQNLSLSMQHHQGPRPPPYDSPLAPETDQSKASGHSASTPTGTPTVVGKRTPSTTHPYSQSEAFANRHHHCERTDSLNRGIWTSYGPLGTQESPTGPPVEMYLRCNHEGCRRIDWKTVHGLQCHIVKSHEQPKGTIGSLEKALDRYGVPVKEVEAYEVEHGHGSGGTMADPKNLKIKNKIREAHLRDSSGQEPGVLISADVDGTPSHSISPPAPTPPAQPTGPRSIGYRPGTMPLGSHMFPNMMRQRSHETPDHVDKTPSDITGSNTDALHSRPAAFIIKPWDGSVAPEAGGHKLQSHIVESAKITTALDEDQEMRDVPPLSATASADQTHSNEAQTAAFSAGDATADHNTMHSQDDAPRQPETADPVEAPLADTASASMTGNLNPAPEERTEVKTEQAIDNPSVAAEAKTAIQAAPATSPEPVAPPPLQATPRTDDVEMQDDVGMLKSATQQLPAPQQPSPITGPPQSYFQPSSPRSTRKPTSRRASAARSHRTEPHVDPPSRNGIGSGGDATEIVGKEDHIATKEPVHEEPKNDDDDGEDSITVAPSPSPRVRNKEAPPGRHVRKRDGRFTRKGKSSGTF